MLKMTCVHCGKESHYTTESPKEETRINSERFGVFPRFLKDAQSLAWPQSELDALDSFWGKEAHAWSAWLDKNGWQIKEEPGNYIFEVPFYEKQTPSGHRVVLQRIEGQNWEMFNPDFKLRKRDATTTTTGFHFMYDYMIGAINEKLKDAEGNAAKQEPEPDAEVLPREIHQNVAIRISKLINHDNLVRDGWKKVYGILVQGYTKKYAGIEINLVVKPGQHRLTAGAYDVSKEFASPYISGLQKAVDDVIAMVHEKLVAVEMPDLSNEINRQNLEKRGWACADINETIYVMSWYNTLSYLAIMPSNEMAFSTPQLGIMNIVSCKNMADVNKYTENLRHQVMNHTPKP